MNSPRKSGIVAPITLYKAEKSAVKLWTVPVPLGIESPLHFKYPVGAAVPPYHITVPTGFNNVP